MAIIIAFLIFLAVALVLSPAPWLQHMFFPRSQGASAGFLGLALTLVFYATIVVVTAWGYYIFQNDGERARLHETYWIYNLKLVEDELAGVGAVLLAFVAMGAIMLLITILLGGWQEIKNATPGLH